MLTQRIFCQIFSAFFFVGSLSTIYAQETLCGDGIDNDGDGLIDCYDTDCGGTGACANFYYGVLPPDCQFIPPSNADTFELELVWQTDETLYPIDQRHTPTVGDIDNDGVPEVLGLDSGTPGYVRVFDGITGNQEIAITVSTGLATFSSPAFADVDDDGTAEIFVIDNSSQLVRLEHDGTTTWTNATVTVPGNKNTTGIADFNQDGTPEVYVANRIFDAITGANLANGTDGTGGGNEGGYNASESFPVPIDVFSSTDIIPETGLACGSDCDGLELVAGNVVYAVNLGAAAIADRLIQVSEVTGTGIGDGVTSVADMDNDGDLDAVIMDNGVIYMWDLTTGTQLYDNYTVPSSTSNGGRINLADFDNDGVMEAGVAGLNVYVLVDTNATSNLVAKWTLASDDGSQRTGSTVFDFEGDGINEVVYSDEEYLYVLNGIDGSDLSRIQSQSGTRFDYPLVVDGNGDGVAEIVITSQDGNGPGFSGNNYIRMYRSKNTPWVAAREVWNQHTFFGTNINDDLSIPIVQQNHHIVPELNGFLVQSTIRLEDGSPSFGAPNVNPSIVGIDNTSCGNDSVTFEVKIGNTGDWKFPYGAPVAFYKGNPRVSGSTLIDTTFVPATVDTKNSQTVNLVMEFTSGDLPGDIYIVLNDTGFANAALPFDISTDFPVTGVGECTYYNNYTHVYLEASCNEASDWDGDGISDNSDLDVDNDGIPDTAEDGGTGFIAMGDEDGDSILNYLDESDATIGFPSFVDANGDGVNDVYDVDDDSVPDAL
ncbi:MAG: VCBS repeat-containing protein, partial [Bacteroidota bacterium]